VKVQDDLIRRGKPRENVKIIPHGIDLNFIDNTPASAERFDLVFAGRLIKDKNVDLALGALALVKKELGRISFLVIGDGPEKAHLKNLVEELGLSGDVVFGGFVNYKTLISRLKSSRIFLFPSSREGFGIVIIEAKACGLPVIAVRHAMNASTDLITQDKDGLLCAMDSQEISAGILRLMRNPDKLKEMSCAARDSVRDYDWNKIAADSEGLYNSLIRKVQA
jgi:glycosyltransferase involved in cell wall biosynthesis